MEHGRNILVYVSEPSEPDPALDVAVRLAEHNQTRLTLVDVDQEISHYWFLESLHEAAITKRQEHLQQLAEPLRERGLAVTTDVLTGAPAVEIARRVTREKHDLVLKTSRVGNLASHLGFSSAGMRLLRTCPAAVWIVQPGHPSFDRVVAAVDPFAREDSEAHMNARVLDTAATLARREDCELHVAWVVPAFGDSQMVSRVPYDQLTRLSDDLESRARDNMSTLIGKHAPSLDIERCHLLRGVPGEEIPRFIDQSHMDLVVLGTAQRSGLDQLVIGSTAERILHAVHCSVLTVKPADFVCPIRVD